MNNQETLLAERNISHKIIEEIVDAYSIETTFGATVLLFVPKNPLTPEDIATLQALYSRSNEPIVGKLLSMLAEGKAHKTTGRVVGMSFKGYGHKSIGDLGNILICYEGVSMLAAKALQDSQLYNGQEASTRFITFEKQPFLFPFKDGLCSTHGLSGVALEAAGIQEEWRKAYISWLPQIVSHLENGEMQWSTWPTNDTMLLREDYEKAQQAWKRTVKARAFDIIRGFLPAGCSTNLAWWTSISHCADHLSWLRCHVLTEVRELATLTQTLCETIYPLSFSGRTLYPEREAYKTAFFKEEYYLEDFTPCDLKQGTPNFRLMYNESLLKVENWKYWIENRPLHQELHYTVGEYFSVYYENLLDFASFRDQQRHRAVVQRQGLLTGEHGFHPWYMDNLPEWLRSSAKILLDEQGKRIHALGLDKFSKQYLLPMGYRIPTRIVGPLGKVIYLVEQRAHTHVHPTMHANAYDLAIRLQKALANEGITCPLDINPNVGALSVTRGNQTFFIGGKALT